MKSGLEEWFKDETAPLFDKRIPYGVRRMQWRRLVQAQEGVVRIQTDGSITTPVDPAETADANEYLERLRQIKLPL